MAPRRLSVVGTGYVGLCTAVAFASKGYRLDKIVPDERFVSDRDAKKVFTLIFKRETPGPE